MDEEELDNDSSDEEYVPEGAENQELPSEEESDGEPEDDGNVSSGDEGPGGVGKKRSRANRRNRASGKTSYKRARVTDSSEVRDEPVTVPVSEEVSKQKTDSLWADFLKDTTTVGKETSSASSSSSTVIPAAAAASLSVRTATVADTVVGGASSNSSSATAAGDNSKTVTVQTVYEFAGEQVIVNRAAAVSASTSSRGGAGSRTRGGGGAGGRGGGGGGLSSVLNQLGKKQKISTLEKSKLDWDRFKQDENIVDELSAHNKGRHGYLERQDFLERADQRQFELEKEMRTKHRSHRS